MYDQRQEKETDTAQVQKRKKRGNIIFVIGIVAAAAFIALIVFAANALINNEDKKMRKPVIYLYPSAAEEISVELDFEEVTVTYPEYKDGWRVTAYPDGTVFDENGNEYSYLFWEANSDMKYDFSEGFCVEGSKTGEFLQWALSEQGLTPKEYNEFIVYWLPLMKENKYNIISFQGQNYEESAPLKISPKPDSIKRVFMAYYASDIRKEIPPQTLEGFERNGFTVVEWGGTCLDD